MAVMCRQQFRGDQSLDAMSSRAAGPSETHQLHLTYASDYEHIRNYFMTSFIILKKWKFYATSQYTSGPG